MLHGVSQQFILSQALAMHSHLPFTDRHSHPSPHVTEMLQARACWSFMALTNSLFQRDRKIKSSPPSLPHLALWVIILKSGQNGTIKVSAWPGMSNQVLLEKLLSIIIQGKETKQYLKFQCYALDGILKLQSLLELQCRGTLHLLKTFALWT